jgi:EmrB/QacA subfamily drug resistance transporter
MSHSATPPAASAAPAEAAPTANPMSALYALIIGFFMILVDSTIVTTAMPAIMKGLKTDINGVVWVTSAYLLAYAVPLLITGRLGDRFGPKRIYLIGLSLFTLASLWCGLAPDIGQLIVARVFQGLGAALMTPQTMAIITRTFPPAKRGAAMGLWGATAGVATLVGPILGGLLVDSLGWEWIFFVNIPVGLIAFWRAYTKVPSLPTHNRAFDWLGVALSAVGMFLLTFAIQEGKAHDWGQIAGPITIPMLIVAGVVIMAVFVWWQSKVKPEPLLPLHLFRVRNFSLGNASIFFVGFFITSMAFPIMIFMQNVRGLTPTQAALTMIPMAVLSGVLAPQVGKRIHGARPGTLAAFGAAMNALGLLMYAWTMTPETPIWVYLLCSAVMGVGSGFMWGPLATGTTNELTDRESGAGSGVYNAVRQFGAVLGSAAVAVVMESQISSQMEAFAKALPTTGQVIAGSPRPSMPGGEASLMGGQVAEILRPAFATAMSHTLIVPALAAACAAVIAVFMHRAPEKPSAESAPAAPAATSATEPAES